MVRHIKRYGNRKLYDSVESRYVSLGEVASWIAQGEQVRVVDNQSGEDVTVQVLTQLISEQGRQGRSFSSALLHDLIRVGEEALLAGEEAVGSRVRHLQETATSLAQTVHQHVVRLRQPSDVEQQIEQLRERLDALEAMLASLQNSDPPPNT